MAIAAVAALGGDGFETLEIGIGVMGLVLQQHARQGGLPLGLGAVGSLQPAAAAMFDCGLRSSV